MTLETHAGTVVAYAKAASYSNNEARYVMVVHNLSTGRVLHKVTTVTLVKPEATPISEGPATALVVKSDGAVAWIVETGFPATYQVYAIDKTGRRMLASSPDIVPHSLALAGNTVHWTQGGEPASAPLN